MTSTCVMTSVPRFASACLPAGRDGVARRRATCARRDARHATAAAAPRVHPGCAPRGPIVLTRAAPEGASTPARRWDKSKSAGADADGADERQVQRKRVRARATAVLVPSSFPTRGARPRPRPSTRRHVSPLTHDNLFFASSLDLSG